MVTHEEMGLSLRKGDNTPRLAYRYVDAHSRKRKLLNAPLDKETTLRRVNRLLAGLRRRRERALRMLDRRLVAHQGRGPRLLWVTEATRRFDFWVPRAMPARSDQGRLTLSVAPHEFIVEARQLES